MENIWVYSIEEDGARGIVIADSKEDAESKVKKAYRKHGYGKDFNFSDMKVWSATEINEGYFNDCPNVLEICG